MLRSLMNSPPQACPHMLLQKAKREEQEDEHRLQPYPLPGLAEGVPAAVVVPRSVGGSAVLIPWLRQGPGFDIIGLKHLPAMCDGV